MRGRMAIVVARDRDYRPTVGTLLECQTHYVLLVALPHGRTTSHVRTAPVAKILT
jgi:hypothetical protein